MFGSVGFNCGSFAGATAPGPAAGVSSGVPVAAPHVRVRFRLRQNERLYDVRPGRWISCDLRVTGLACLRSGRLTYYRRGEARARDTHASAGAVLRGPITGVHWAATEAGVQAVVVSVPLAGVAEGERCE